MRSFEGKTIYHVSVPHVTCCQKIVSEELGLKISSSSANINTVRLPNTDSRATIIILTALTEPCRTPIHLSIISIKILYTLLQIQNKNVILVVNRKILVFKKHRYFFY